MDARFARQKLRDADALNGLAEAHLVGEDGTSCAHRERDPVELIGEKVLLQQPLPERDELPLKERLGVRSDEERVAARVQSLQPANEIGDLDRTPEKRRHDRPGLGCELLRQRHREGDTVVVSKVHGDPPPGG
jgi:hypothetical protein